MVSCGEDREPVEPLVGFGGEYTVEADKCALLLSEFTANEAWDSYIKSADESWITLSQTEGEAGVYRLTANIAENSTEAERTATIVIRSKNASIEYKITQSAKPAAPDNPDNPSQPVTPDQPGESGGGEDISVVDKTQLIESIKIHHRSMSTGQVVDEENIALEYDAQGRVIASHYTHANTKVDLGITYNDTEIAFIGAQNITMAISGGKVTKIGDNDCLYSSGVLYQVKSYTFDWKGNYLNNIVGTKTINLEYFGSDDFTSKANIDLQIYVPFFLSDTKLFQVLPYFQTCLYSRINQLLPITITIADEEYKLNYLTDNNGRINKIQISKVYANDHISNSTLYEMYVEYVD